MKRYGGLKKATITVRDDGLLDVVRERDTGNGDAIKGCATLEEACDAIYAHDGETLRSVRRERDIYRAALNEIAADGCPDPGCFCCGFDQGNAKAALRSGLVRGEERKGKGT